MCRSLSSEQHDLHDNLIACGVVRKRAVELQNLMTHCQYQSWVIDELRAYDLIVATLKTTFEHLDSYADYARSEGKTLCIISPYHNANRWEVCKRIIAEHPSTTVDNRGYLLVFNNHLPKQEFRL